MARCYIMRSPQRKWDFQLRTFPPSLRVRARTLFSLSLSLSDGSLSLSLSLPRKMLSSSTMNGWCLAVVVMVSVSAVFFREGASERGFAGSFSDHDPLITLGSASTVCLAASSVGRQHFNSDKATASGGLVYDFYGDSCPQVETVIRSTMALLYSQHKNASAGLLRLFFHNCFIRGCDASVLLDDSFGNKSHRI